LSGRLPSVTVDGYSLQLRHKDGFIGDQASQSAFRKLLERWRRRRRAKGEDPLGEEHSTELSKQVLDAFRRQRCCGAKNGATPTNAPAARRWSTDSPGCSKRRFATAAKRESGWRLSSASPARD
ncbi:MAG TPA: hypothetical protein VGI11_01395, partial [Variovorax sp.]